MSDVTCPYCKHEQEVCYDDGFGCSEDRTWEMECEKCSKHFIFETAIHLSHRALKADCLNDGNHKWKRLYEYKGIWYLAECKLCGREQRFNMTED